MPLGAYLSPGYDGPQKLMIDVVAKGVVAEMERRMFTINQEVNSSRKGLKNTFKSWWRNQKSQSERNGDPSMITNQLNHKYVYSGILLLWCAIMS